MFSQVHFRMKLLIFLTILNLSRTKQIANYECVRNIKYEKEVLKENVSGPYQLVIDYNTNTLFFSYAARTDEYFKIAHLNLNTKKYGLVHGIHEGFANAIDNFSHKVYMGGEDGIYEYDYKTNEATSLGIPKKKTNIWQMFYCNGLYFSTYPEEKAYLYKDGVVEEVSGIAPNKAMTIAATKSDNIYYSNSSGLFLYDKVAGKSFKRHDAVVNGFSTDNDNNLYFSAANGIYRINESNDTIEEILSVTDCYGVAIERNGDIVYAQSESVTRLKRTNEDCVVEDLKN